MLAAQIFLLISSVIAVVISEEYPLKIKYLVEHTETLNTNNVSYRLPNETHPETYDLSLVTRVDEGDFNYEGVVKIEIVVDSPTRKIVLHKSRLTVLDIKLTKITGAALELVPILPYTYDSVTEKLTISTSETILNTGDRLNLDISFVNVLSTDGRGFYRTSYDDSTGNKV